jgi:diadenylate cyclase
MNALYTSFQNITFPEMLDITLLACALYVILLFIKKTKSYVLAGVIILLLTVYFLSQNLNLTLVRSIIQPTYTFIFIIIAIVFQRELRRFFKWIIVGQLDIFTSSKQISKGASAEIAESLLYMAEKKIGAIIVFPGKQDLEDITEGGQKLNGDITKEILLSIFDSSSPGHDGAVIVDGNSIKEFGVHLPLAREYSQYRKTGTRHRAGAGITEDTDAIALVVSEERGVITLFKQGKMTVLKNEVELRDVLKKLTGETEVKNSSFLNFFFMKNLETKIIALTLAVTTWSLFYAQVGVVKKEYMIPLSFQLLSDNLKIDAVSGKKQIKIILEGKNSDISALDVSKLEVRVDAKDFKAGVEKVEITESMINVPAFIEVSEISPRGVSVGVERESM